MNLSINTTTAPLLLQAGEGKQIKLKNVTITHKAMSDVTASAWSLLEYEAPPHFAGPPLHWHATLEAFYILSGVVTFRLGTHTFRAESGAFVLVPPGTLHTFSNHAEESARFLLLASPGDFGHYFAELAELANSATIWPPSHPDTLAALSLLEQKYGIYH